MRSHVNGFLARVHLNMGSKKSYLISLLDISYDGTSVDKLGFV